MAQTVKNPPAKPGDTRNTDLIPGPGRSPRERNGYPLQYSCLGNSMDREAWQIALHGVAESGHDSSINTFAMIQTTTKPKCNSS